MIKYLIPVLLFIFSFNSLTAQNRQVEMQTTSRLALSYYNDKEYEKAAPLLLEVYHLSQNSYYFRLFLSSLIETNRFDEAAEQIQKEIQRQKAQKKVFPTKPAALFLIGDLSPQNSEAKGTAAGILCSLGLYI